MTTEELLELRARQLAERDEDLEEARAKMKRMRNEQRELWDEGHASGMRTEPLKEEEIVLLENTKLRKDFGKKLNFQ